MNLFVNSNRQLRDIWWVAVFFLVLASLTFPLILLSQYYHWEITMAHQVLIVIAASWICQLMRRKPLTELTGYLNAAWLQNLLKGFFIGSGMMVIPALFLFLGGWVKWESQSQSIWTLLAATGLFAGVALAEEFLFRGFIFQRLIASVGTWGAQLVLAAYFLLTHMNNPGMTGGIKVLAFVNIFAASLLFGLAFIRTKSLSVPIGIHFMANWTQGTLLGFGVSGNENAGILRPVFKQAPEWLTGGSFGLEASLPGLIMVLITLFMLYKWKPSPARLPEPGFI